MRAKEAATAKLPRTLTKDVNIPPGPDFADHLLRVPVPNQPRFHPFRRILPMKNPQPTYVEENRLLPIWLRFESYSTFALQAKLEAVIPEASSRKVPL